MALIRQQTPKDKAYTIFGIYQLEDDPNSKFSKNMYQMSKMELKACLCSMNKTNHMLCGEAVLSEEMLDKRVEEYYKKYDQNNDLSLQREEFALICKTDTIILQFLRLCGLFTQEDSTALSAMDEDFDMDLQNELTLKHQQTNMADA